MTRDVLVVLAWWITVVGLAGWLVLAPLTADGEMREIQQSPTLKLR